MLIRSIFFVYLISVPKIASAQSPDTVQPKDRGFRAYTIASDVGPVNIYVSSGGQPADTTDRRPLVLYLQGSNYAPIVSGPPDSIRTTLFFGPKNFSEFHYAVVGKPAASFWAKKIDNTPQAYHDILSLGWRVKAASTAIEWLIKKSWVDSTQVLVVGHSEGAQVAPALAVANSHVTHVVAMAGGALSQMLDFVLMVRHRVRAGELAFEEGQSQIAELHNQFRRIYAHPKATDSLWAGDHSYLRWSTFFKPPLESYLQLDIPIFVAAGSNDHASPIENTDYLPLAFIRAGKTNLTYRVWPTNHYFREITEKGKIIDHRVDVLRTLKKWLKEN